MSALHPDNFTFAVHQEKRLVLIVPFKVCIDHIFENLESKKTEIIVLEKNLEVWIQKSVRTLVEEICHVISTSSSCWEIHIV